MRVCLLNPTYLKKFSRPQRSPATTKSGTLYYPIWLAQAAAVLDAEGHEIDLIDAPADDLSVEQVRTRVTAFAPEVLVVGTSTPSIENDVARAAELKKQLGTCAVLLVGTHVSALPEETLEIDHTIDAVARREYDYTVRDFVTAVGEGKSLSTVEGISYRDAEKVIHNADRPYIETLDDLPFVSPIYKRFLKTENYFNPNALYPMVTLITTRGCPYQCSFCVYPQTLTGHGIRARSLDNVVEEMKYVRDAFPEVKAIFFEDDTLTASNKRCRELSEAIIASGVDISWTANGRVGLDYETLRVMKQSGCRLLCVGFESGNQELLDNIKKNIKVEDMAPFARDARKAGILIHGCFMAGLPGETRETLEETLALAKRLKLDTCQFYPIMVYPGTRAYAWYKESGLITTDTFSEWLTPEGLHNTVIQTAELSREDLVHFCDRARREFYLHPSYLLYQVRRMITNPSEIRRTFKAARIFLKYLIKGSDV